MVYSIDKETKDIWFDLIKVRDSTTLKTFVYNLIEPGSHLIHGWRSYKLLNSNDSVYALEEHNHGEEIFGKVLLVPTILNLLGVL